MRVSIYVRNTNGNLFIITNSISSKLALGGEYNIKFLGCEKQDLVYTPSKTKRTEIVHRSKSVEESEFLIEYIHKKLKEKAKVMMERQVLKKIRSDSVEYLIDEVNERLHNEFFEIDISGLLIIYRSKI